MSPVDEQEFQADESRVAPAVQCDACQSALDSHGRRSVSFLLLDHLTVPLLGCDDHLEQFASVCGFTTDGTAELLHHRPAGGLGCPGCRLAPHEPDHPMIAVEDGAAVVLACETHQSAVVDRFHAGRQTQQQLATSLDTSQSV